MKVTIYPRLIPKGKMLINPYISDFVYALEQSGVCIANSPHKNPLFSIVFGRTDSDAYIFHWLENVPDYKYGVLQTIAAIWLLFKIKLNHKKVIWFLHNKQPHTGKHKLAKKLLIKWLVRKADLIVTHATEGIRLIDKQYPKALSKVYFMHHPTKNRITIKQQYRPETDLLIWGNISRYKGVLEFARYLNKQELQLKTKIIGKCNSKTMSDELSSLSNEFVSFENRSISFQELESQIQKSRFVLVPYASESVLSSGILMDSLSFGAKVIGPNVGSFRDYAKEPLLKVYTFNTFDDIAPIIQKADDEVDIEGYHRFLDAHSWKCFGQEFYSHLQHTIKQ